MARRIPAISIDSSELPTSFICFRPQGGRWVRRPSPPPYPPPQAGEGKLIYSPPPAEEGELIYSPPRAGEGRVGVGATPTVPAERPLASTALPASPESRRTARPPAHRARRSRWRQYAHLPRS